MRKSSTAIVTTLALALSVSGAALAAVTHVSGQGISYDPGIALEDARADAVSKCTSQGGEPIEEVEQEPFVAVPTLETPHFTELDPRLEPTQMEFHFEEAAETRREEAA